MKFLEKVIAGIMIGFLTYLFVVPVIHELGHYFYAIINNWRVLSVTISFPALVTQSYVMVVIPEGVSPTLFYIAGSFHTLLWGFLISLIPILLKRLNQRPYHHIFLAVGYGLISDSIIYPIYDFWFWKMGDFHLAGLIPTLIVITFGAMAIFLSVGFNNIMRGYSLKV